MAPTFLGNVWTLAGKSYAVFLLHEIVISNAAQGCNVSEWTMERSYVTTVVTSRKWQIFALNLQRRINLVTRSVYCAFKAVLQDQE
jgi:hypothetical protein